MQCVFSFTMETTGSEIGPLEDIEMSREVKEAIGFVFNYQPFRCYDAAPRIMAALLKNNVPLEDCSILTTPSSGHYWVRIDGRDISTVDMSNFRESPTKNDRCEELEKEAKTHATGDSAEEYSKWFYDKDEAIKKKHEATVEKLKNSFVE